MDYRQSILPFDQETFGEERSVLELLDVIADIFQGLFALLFELDADLGIGVLEPCIAGCRALLENDSFHGSYGFLAEF